MAIALQNEQNLHINTNKIYLLFFLQKKLITEGETRERERERERVYTYAKKATVGESGDADFAATAASNTMTFEILLLLFRQQKLNSLA